MAASSIFLPSLAVSLLSLITSLASYLTLALLASSFGTGTEVDAFFAAFTFPQLLLAILTSSIINSFLPFFIEQKQKNGWQAAQLAGHSFRLFASSLLVLSGAGWFLAFPFIRLTNPGLSLEATQLAASFFPLLLFASFFSGSSLLLLGLHYAHHIFIWPSLVQLFNNLVALFFLLLFRSSWGIKSLVWGTLAGSALQFFLLLPFPLRRRNLSLKAKAKREDLLSLSRLLLPLLIAAFFYRANPLVERYLASRLGEGNIAYLGYAGKIISALLVLLSQGISTVLFPRMAEQATLTYWPQLGETLSRAWRSLTIIAVPVTIFLTAFSPGIIAFLFQRGDFSTMATEAVAIALLAYSGYFFLGVLAMPMVNTFYSLKKTSLVARIGLLGFGFYILLAIFLSNRFGFAGIAAASSGQYILTFTIFSLLLSRYLGSLPWKKVGQTLLKSLFAAAMALIPAWSLRLILSHRPWLSPLLLLGQFLVFGVIYFSLLKLLKTEELLFLRKGLSFHGFKR